MKIIYVTHQTPTNDEEVIRRTSMAKQSIEEQLKKYGNWIICNPEYRRDATSIGDINLPFIRDMINAGIEIAEDKDIVLLLNADICLAPYATERIKNACESGGATWSHRYDFDRIDRLIESESEFDKGRWYCGTDLFAMRKEWWLKFGHIFPDAVLGREAWDMLLRRTMRENGGIEIKKISYHEWHPSPWELDRDGLAGNVHNRNLASAWIAEHGGDYYDWKES